MKKLKRVSLFRVKIENRFKDQLLMELSELNCVHIKEISTLDLKEKSDEKDPVVNTIRDLRKKFNVLLSKLGISEFDLSELRLKKEDRYVFEVKNIYELINQTKEEIKFYLNRVKELENYISKAKIELENITIIQASYDLLYNLNFNRDSLSYFKGLKFRLFTTFSKNLSNLENLFDSKEFPCVYQISNINEERLCYFIVYPKFNEERFQARIKLVHSEEIPILKKYLTPQGINTKRILNEIEYTKGSISKYQKELTHIGKDQFTKFAAINEIIQNIEEYNWAEHQFEFLTLDQILIRFFVPTSIKDEIIQTLYEIFKENIIIETLDIAKNTPTYETEKLSPIAKKLKNKDKDPSLTEEMEKEEKSNDLRDEAPTILRNKFPFRPYETILKLYGIPAYSEIDPTPIIAFTFPFLFGIMFGDVGHGLILIIAGLLGALKFRKKSVGYVNMSWVIFFCGWAAMFFGFMYGEIFGRHALEIFGNFVFELEPVMMPFFNISLHSPLENIMTVFFFAVTIGVYHINLGWFIQFLNYWRQRKRYLAVADSLMKIFLLTGGTYLIFTYGFNIMDQWLAPPYPILFTIIPGLLLLLLKPIGKVIGISYLQEESFGGLLGEGTIEAFETVLSVMSNIASYIRLLALALAHIALLLSFNAMASLIQGEGIFVEIAQIPGEVIGNIVVILLEGLLVFLNTMRLHFYEFFFKFYQGSGVEYYPFYIDEEYSKIKFQLSSEKDLISEEIDKGIVKRISQENIENALKYIAKNY